MYRIKVEKVGMKEEMGRDKLRSAICVSSDNQLER